MTNINSLTPNLMVEDVAETVEWYGKTFGAEVVAQLPPDEDAPWWAQVVVDEVSLMFQERENLEAKLPGLRGLEIGRSMPLFLTVQDVQLLHDRLESAEVEFVQELHETEFGWFQFAVADLNGYTLWFGEKITPEKLGPVVR